jgi:hypothetical protein
LEESVKLLKSNNDHLENDLKESFISITSLKAELKKHAALITE